MLQGPGNDNRLALSFDIGSNEFLNISLDISSIDLDRFGGPFVGASAIPTFTFTLFDNPAGTTGLSGNNNVLSTQQASGTASARDMFDWTEVLLALEATGSINGNVTLQIDLVAGAHAARDNFRIVARV